MRVLVHVKPGSRFPQVGGTHDGALVVKVRAVAAGGAATEEALAAVAAALGVPRTRVDLLRGATSRRKLLLVDGGEPAALAALLGVSDQS